MIFLKFGIVFYTKLYLILYLVLATLLELKRPLDTATGYSIYRLSLSLVADTVSLLLIIEIRGPLIEILPPGDIEILFDSSNNGLPLIG